MEGERRPKFIHITTHKWINQTKNDKIPTTNLKPNVAKCPTATKLSGNGRVEEKTCLPVSFGTVGQRTATTYRNAFTYGME
jgi:hypothetical protein